MFHATHLIKTDVMKPVWTCNHFIVTHSGGALVGSTKVSQFYVCLSNMLYLYYTFLQMHHTLSHTHTYTNSIQLCLFANTPSRKHYNWENIFRKQPASEAYCLLAEKREMIKDRKTIPDLVN